MPSYLEMTMIAVPFSYVVHDLSSGVDTLGPSMMHAE